MDNNDFSALFTAPVNGQQAQPDNFAGLFTAPLAQKVGKADIGPPPIPGSPNYVEANTPTPSLAEKAFHALTGGQEPPKNPRELLGTFAEGAEAIPEGILLAKGINALGGIGGKAAPYLNPILQSMEQPAISGKALAGSMAAAGALNVMGKGVASQESIPSGLAPAVDVATQMLTSPLVEKVGTTLGTIPNALRQGWRGLKAALGAPESLVAARLRAGSDANGLGAHLPDAAAIDQAAANRLQQTGAQAIQEATSPVQAQLSNFPGGGGQDTYAKQIGASVNALAEKPATVLASQQSTAEDAARVAQDVARNKAATLQGIYGQAKTPTELQFETTAQEAGKALAAPVSDAAALGKSLEKKYWAAVPGDTEFNSSAFQPIVDQHMAQLKQEAGQRNSTQEQHVLETIAGWAGKPVTLDTVHTTISDLGGVIRSIQDGTSPLINGVTKPQAISRLQAIRSGLLNELERQGADPAIFTQALAAQGFAPAQQAILRNEAVKNLQLASQQTKQYHATFEGAPGDPHEIGDLLARHSQGERVDPEDITKLLMTTDSGMQRYLRAASGEGIVLGRNEDGSFQTMVPNYVKGEDSLGKALAFDLRRKGILTEGGLDPDKYAKYKEENPTILQVLGDRVSSKFEAAAQAQKAAQEVGQTVESLKDAQQNILANLPVKIGTTPAEIVTKYFPKGPEGENSVNAFITDMGGRSPQAVTLAKNMMAAKFRASPAFDEATGLVNSAAYDTFMAQHAGVFKGLDEKLSPNIRAQFTNIGEAQKTLDATIANEGAAQKAFEKTSFIKSGLFGENPDSIQQLAIKNDKGFALNKTLRDINTSTFLTAEEKTAAREYIKDAIGATLVQSVKGEGLLTPVNAARLISNNKAALTNLFGDGYKNLTILRDIVTSGGDFSLQEARYLGKRAILAYILHSSGKLGLTGLTGAAASAETGMGAHAGALAVGSLAALAGHKLYQSGIHNTNDMLLQAITNPAFGRQILAENAATPLNLRRAFSRLNPKTTYGAAAALTYATPEARDQ